MFTVLTICSLGLYIIASFCIYLIILNRYLILLPDSVYKSPVIYSVFAIMMCGSLWLGLELPINPYILLPILILLLVFLGELRQVFLRRKYTASPPITDRDFELDIRTPITTTHLVTHQYAIILPRYKGPTFRIVHLTDMHVHSEIPFEYYQKTMELAERLNPDLAFFTGDFVSKTKDIPLLQKILRPIGKLGNFASLGNHDYWSDPDKVKEVITKSGITLLVNKTVDFNLHGHPVFITGLDYPWGTKIKSLQFTEKDVLHFVLSHTADNIYRLSEKKVDCVFSGHYHGGQFRIPGFGSVVVPSIYGRRFDHGHFIVNGTHLFVASGIGVADPIIRIYCQPDIFIVDITNNLQ